MSGVRAPLTALAFLVLIHLNVMVIAGVYSCVTAAETYGVAPGGQITWGNGPDLQHLKVSLVFSLPLLLPEIAAVVWPRWWTVPVGVVAAAGAGFFHAWDASFIVGARFFGSTEAVTRADISSAMTAALELGCLHLGALITGAVGLSLIHRGVRAQRAKSASESG